MDKKLFFMGQLTDKDFLTVMVLLPIACHDDNTNTDTNIDFIYYLKQPMSPQALSEFYTLG